MKRLPLALGATHVCCEASALKARRKHLLMLISQTSVSVTRSWSFNKATKIERVARLRTSARVAVAAS